MSQIVDVRLREAGVTAAFLYDDLEIISGDFVVVEADRGVDYGQIVGEPQEVAEANKRKYKKILRIMNVDDMRQVKENGRRVKEDIRLCEEKIREYRLDMKLIHAEYAFDRSKIIFYFTSEGRVDFRDLVKDLARQFKMRIEMRQVGVRDEAKLFGGVGPCGRALCCAAFLRNFEPVTIKMAKEQNLPLNPTKISGICGRLMCCLGYESKCYRELKKELPREGQIIQTDKGKAKVLKVQILKGDLLLEYEDGRIERLNYHEKCSQECGKGEQGTCRRGDAAPHVSETDGGGAEGGRSEAARPQSGRPEGGRPQRPRPDNRRSGGNRSGGGQRGPQDKRPQQRDQRRSRPS